MDREIRIGVRAMGHRFADTAERQRPALTRRHRGGGPHWQQLRVRARESDGGCSRRVQRRHEPRVDRASEHRDDDFERVRIGDADPVHLLRNDADAAEHGIDGAAATMDDHEARRVPSGVRDRARDLLKLFGCLEELAPEFQYRDPGH